MSNVIDAIIGKQAQSEVDVLISKLQAAQKLQIDIQNQALNNTKGRGSVKTPGDLNNRVSENARLTAELQKEVTIRQKLQAQIEKQRLAEIKLAQDREKAVDKFTSAEKKAQAVLSKSENLYNKIQAKVSSLTQTYNNLAAKQAIGLRLNDREIGQLESLTGRINKYQEVLKKVDGNVGKFTRNVGNYGSAYNGLGNSIAQLTREAPAFTVSLNTGFLALSNNLPILFDEIQKTQAGIAALKAEGQAAPSLFSQIAKNVFSLQTALSLAVLGLTLFGGELIDSLFGLEETKKAAEEKKKVQEEAIKVEEQYTETIRKTAAEEQTRAKTLFENAANEKLSLDVRKKAIDELRERYPAYLKNLSDQQLLAGDTADAENRLNEALIKRGVALAVQDKIKLKYAELTDEIIKQQQEQKRLLNIEADVRKSSQDRLKSLKDNALAQANARKEEERALKLAPIIAQNNIKNSFARQKTIKKDIEALYDLFNANSEYLDVVREGGKVSKKTAEENAQNITNSVNAFEEQIAALTKTRDSVEAGSEAYKFLDGTIQLLQETLDGLKGSLSEVKETVEEGITISDEELYSEYYAWLKLKDATDEYIRTIANTTLGDMGLGSLQQFFDGTFNKLIEGADNLKEKFAVTFATIAQVATEAMAFIDQAQQAQFQSQYDRLESQKDISIKFAGDSEDAKAEIMDQYEQRRKQIAKQQAEAQKKQAIFSILLNTASGVVAALASVPPNVPLSIAIGVIGAIQAGIVASTPVPAFAEGGIHEGGLMLVNDAKGSNYRETIITPDGKMMRPEGRNVIMNAPKGTEILTPEQFERQYNDFMSSQGILPSSGTRAAKQISNKTSQEIDYNKMTDSFTKAMSRQPKPASLILQRDEHGEKVFKVTENSREELMNAKIHFQSR